MGSWVTKSVPLGFESGPSVRMSCGGLTYYWDSQGGGKTAGTERPWTWACSLVASTALAASRDEMPGWSVMCWAMSATTRGGAKDVPLQGAKPVKVAGVGG